ncbi:DUF6364 family protein [Thioalkalivibrio sp. AKL7]|uniref:DUF6364 family protein n=1 Tax=Thioalkalivibrio sp. AKL7 TaxID=1158155 RepID=UPI0003758AF4|nr:DUF6364 family protein [Thioalkalivibrio sp. AKL7]
MEQETTKVTVRLPKQDVEFAKAYAKAHGMSMTEVIDRHLRRLRALERHAPSAELEAITGLIPADVDAEQAYHDHLRDKHQS